MALTKRNPTQQSSPAEAAAHALREISYDPVPSPPAASAASLAALSSAAASAGSGATHGGRLHVRPSLCRLATSSKEGGLVCDQWPQ